MVRSVPAARRAYTLVEVLIVVTILGIAASMVVPTMTGSGPLRVQAAVRAIVADITEMQSDALAFQRGRAIVFHPDTNSYNLVEVTGTTLDENLDRISTTRITREDYGEAKIVSANFDDDATLIFDELGAPVTTPMGTTPGANGKIVVTGAGEKFEITVEGYTGRITVKRVP